MPDKEMLYDTFTSKTPWEMGKNPIWLATAMILHRNISPYLFPHRISEGDAKNTLSLLEKHLSPLLEEPLLLNHENLSPSDKEFLFEHFILSEGYEKFDAKKALLIDKSASLLGLLNVEDHLHLHLFTLEEDLTPLWQKLSKLEKNLSEKLPFAFSDRFGYLTSNPSICGTGLVVQAFLHLPTLITLKKFPEIKDTLESTLSFRGLGKEDEYVADLVLLENRYTIGVSEEETLAHVSKGAETLMQAEKDLRQHLSPAETEELKGHVSRAYGLFSHAYTLELHETLQALSLLSLAKELGWLKNAPHFQFSHLFFSIRRAHLLKHEQSIPKETLTLKRAHLIKQTLEGSSLSLP